MKIKFLLILVLCCLTQSARSGGISGQGNLVGTGVFIAGDCLKSFGGLFVQDAGAPCGSGGGASPGGTINDVQLNNGAGGFAGSDSLIFQTGFLTINGDSGYGQLQFTDTPATSAYGGAGINGANDQIIVGALAGDLSIWNLQGINFSADTGTTNMLEIAPSGFIGIGSSLPVASLDLSQRTDALALPVGTTGQRPTGLNGMIRYNSSGTPVIEGYVNNSWKSLLTAAVTSVSVVTANGVSGSVANPTTTPAITLTLGAITPSSVNGVTITNANAPTWTIGSSSGVPVVTASSPLVITSATGDITCPTCNTTSSNVTSVSNSDGTLTISPTTGVVVGSLALGHANSWTGQQTFGTSSPIFSTMTSGSVLFAGAAGILSQDNANFFWDDSNNRLGLGVVTPTNILSFSGQSAQTIWTERQTTSNTAGNNLTLAVGGASSGATNKAGGNLIFAGGTATGTATSSILFQVPLASATGTADNAPQTVLTIGAGGSITYTGLTNSTPASSPAAGAIINLLTAQGQPNNGSGIILSPVNIGGNFQVTTGAGGVSTAGTTLNAAGGGGSFNLSSGVGGVASSNVASTTNTGGVGGFYALSSGNGGASSGSGNTNVGGQGGQLTFRSGNGGVATTAGAVANTGGKGGPYGFTSGNGGAALSGTGGVGGDFTFTGGNGGTASTSGTGGRGANLLFITGVGGVGSGGASSGANGTFTLKIGASTVQFINASGLTSIGSGTTALSTLDVFGGTAIGSYAGANAAPSNGLIVSGSVGIGTSSQIYKIDMVGGDIGIGTTGGRLRFKEAANGSMGTGTLVGGTLLINNTSITANSRIFLTDTGGGVIANIGALYVSATSVGASFTVSSSNVLDTSTFNWVIFEPY